jgi:hypothetical protein
MLLLVCLILCSCRQEEKKQIHSLQQKHQVQVKEKEVIANIDETFPFSDTKKIEIISYPDRFTWDTLPNSIEGSKRISASVVNGKLNLNKTGIKERLIVNKEIERKLFSFFFIEQCPENYSNMLCFTPRHTILFYNNEDKIISHVDVCIQCADFQASFPCNEMCVERVEGLLEIFKEAGIKYFGEEE